MYVVPSLARICQCKPIEWSEEDRRCGNIKMQADWNGKNATERVEKKHMYWRPTHRHISRTNTIATGVRIQNRNNRLLHLHGSDPIILLLMPNEKNHIK